MLGSGRKRWANQERGDEFVMADDDYARLFQDAAGAKSGARREGSIRVIDSLARRELFDGHAGRLSGAGQGVISPRHNQQVSYEGAAGGAPSNNPDLFRYYENTKLVSQEAVASEPAAPKPGFYEVIQQHERSRQEQLKEQQNRAQLKEERQRLLFEGAHGVLSGPLSTLSPRKPVDVQAYEGCAGGGVSSWNSPREKRIRVDSAAKVSQVDELLFPRGVDNSVERMEARVQAAQFEGAAGCKSFVRRDPAKLEPVIELPWTSRRAEPADHGLRSPAPPAAPPPHHLGASLESRPGGQERDSIDNFLSGFELSIKPATENWY
eukprot:TRINITY_DN49217_c0_g1_i1.p1 TRINITY_DN49217_c0_g1~~TRINITY_DN49217_c0_g1_i1.p1  ORF type:complete len:322 (+),score=59.45 TRINITY_DN49217_c0_g1_i1:86-1051(+)